MADKNLEKLVNKIENCYLNEKLEEALKIIKAIQKEGIINKKIEEIEGLIYIKKKHYIKGYKKLENASKDVRFSNFSKIKLANYYFQNKSFQKAVNLLESIQNKDRDISLLKDIAYCYLQIENFKKALDYLIKIEKLGNESAELSYNTGRIFDELGNTELAIKYYKKAITQDGSRVEPYINIGSILQLKKQYYEAINYYKIALSINKKINYLYGDILNCYKNLIDIHNYKLIYKEIFKNNEFINQIEPFQFLSVSDCPELQLRVARKYVENKLRGIQDDFKREKIIKNQRIKIGYVSADFKQHPTSHLISELIERHNTDNFEIVLISLTKLNLQDQITKRYLQCNKEMIDISGLGINGQINFLRKLDLDIAVDLMGFTTGSRAAIYKKRVAPIQINYLGYPGSMGMKEMDYIIADRKLIPISQRINYSERIIYLPEVFQPYDTRKTCQGFIDNKKSNIVLSNLGIDDSKFIYCCFNSIHKINQEVLETWAEILSKVENSILWLVINDEISRKNIIEFFISKKISKDRIFLTIQVEYSLYLENLKLVDVFLDTWPFCGGTTCRDVMWSGAPIVTLEGESFAGRMASSLLRAADLSDLVARDRSSYVSISVELAKNINKHQFFKEKIVNLRKSKLFEIQDYVNNLEKAYFNVFNIYIQNKSPHDIEI